MNLVRNVNKDPPLADNSIDRFSEVHRTCEKADPESLASGPFLYEDSPRPEMLSFVPKHAKRVLDVGCHMGAFGRAIKIRGDAEVWGIEPNPSTAIAASKLLDRVVVGFFSEDVALPDHYFDAIVFNDVLEHMPDPWAALKLARTKLAKGAASSSRYRTCGILKTCFIS